MGKKFAKQSGPPVPKKYSFLDTKGKLKAHGSSKVEQEAIKTLKDEIAASIVDKAIESIKPNKNLFSEFIAKLNSHSAGFPTTSPVFDKEAVKKAEFYAAAYGGDGYSKLNVAKYSKQAKLDAAVKQLILNSEPPGSKIDLIDTSFHAYENVWVVDYMVKASAVDGWVPKSVKLTKDAVEDLNFKIYDPVGLDFAKVEQQVAAKLFTDKVSTGGKPWIDTAISKFGYDLKKSSDAMQELHNALIEEPSSTGTIYKVLEGEAFPVGQLGDMVEAPSGMWLKKVIGWVPITVGLSGEQPKKLITGDPEGIPVGFVKECKIAGAYYKADDCAYLNHDDAYFAVGEGVAVELTKDELKELWHVPNGKYVEDEVEEKTTEDVKASVYYTSNVPVIPAVGDYWLNTKTKEVQVFGGTAWLSNKPVEEDSEFELFVPAQAGLNEPFCYNKKCDLGNKIGKVPFGTLSWKTAQFAGAPYLKVGDDLTPMDSMGKEQMHVRQLVVLEVDGVPTQVILCEGCAKALKNKKGQSESAMGVGFA